MDQIEQFERAERVNREAAEAFYGTEPGSNKVEVAPFPEYYPETPEPSQEIPLRDIPERVVADLHRINTASIPKALGHYANQLRPVLDPESFQELTELVKEADSVAYDTDLLRQVQKKSVYFFGQLMVNRPKGAK